MARPHNRIEVNVSRLPVSCRILVEDTIDLANENGFCVKLLDVPIIYLDPKTQSMPITGVFEEDLCRLTTAARRPLDRWVGVLAHESCHLDQCLEKTRVWKNGDYVYDFDEWLEGRKHIPPAILRRYTRFIQHLELDCEIRTTEKIITYNLPIDIPTYIQQSNAYVYFYEAVRRTKKWCRKGTQPFIEPTIYKRMPKDFLPLDEYANLTPRMLNLFKQFM